MLVSSLNRITFELNATYPLHTYLSSRLTTTDIIVSTTLARVTSLDLLVSLATSGLPFLIDDLVVEASAPAKTLTVCVVSNSPTDHLALSDGSSLLVLMGVLPLLLLVVATLSLLLNLLATLVSTKASLLVALVSDTTSAIDLLHALLSELALNAASSWLVVSTLRGVDLSTTEFSPLSPIVIIGLISTAAYIYS